MVRLYTERQAASPGATPGLTLEAVIELLQITPEEAKRLLDEVRMPALPTLASPSEKKTLGRKFPKGAFVAVAVIVSVIWIVAIATAMGKITHNNFGTRSTSFSGRMARSAPKGFDVGVDANGVAAEMIGGPKAGQNLSKLTVHESAELRHQLEDTALDSLADLHPSFYAMPPNTNGDGQRLLTFKVRPFGATWTKMQVPVEPYMVDNLRDGSLGREALKELLDRQLKARWKEIIKSAEPSSAEELAPGQL